MIFVRKLPKYHRIGMAPPYQISDWYGGRYTCSVGSAHVALP